MHACIHTYVTARHAWAKVLLAASLAGFFPDSCGTQGNTTPLQTYRYEHNTQVKYRVCLTPVIYIYIYIFIYSELQADELRAVEEVGGQHGRRGVASEVHK